MVGGLAWHPTRNWIERTGLQLLAPPGHLRHRRAGRAHKSGTPKPMPRQATTFALVVALELDASGSRDPIWTAQLIKPAMARRLPLSSFWRAEHNPDVGFTVSCTKLPTVFFICAEKLQRYGWGFT